MLVFELRFLRHPFVTLAVGFFFCVMFRSCLPEFTDTWSANCTNQARQTAFDTMALPTSPTILGNINPNRKYAVFSTTSAGNAESLGFIFMLPLTALAWKRIGFYSIVIIVGSENVWNSDPLLYTVLTSVRKLDAVVIFLDIHPANSVMVSQVRNICSFYPRDAMLARVFATATCPSVRLSVCPFVCHTPVLCLAERKQDSEMYTI